jgi:hypothetical protein
MYAFTPEKPLRLVDRNFYLAISCLFAKASTFIMQQKSAYRCVAESFQNFDMPLESFAPESYVL